MRGLPQYEVKVGMNVKTVGRDRSYQYGVFRVESIDQPFAVLKRIAGDDEELVGMIGEIDLREYYVWEVSQAYIDDLQKATSTRKEERWQAEKKRREQAIRRNSRS